MCSFKYFGSSSYSKSNQINPCHVKSVHVKNTMSYITSYRESIYRLSCNAMTFKLHLLPFMLYSRIDFL